MKEHIQQLYDEVLELRAKVQMALAVETDALQKEARLGELADIAYAASQMETLFDDSRKECKRLRETSERLACLYWMRRGNTDPIRTPWVTASPNMSQFASCPRRRVEPEAYAALMNHLGIPEDVWQREEELVRPHFPGWVAYLTELAEAGKPLPPGIDPNKVYHKYSLRLRPKKGVNEDAE